MEVARGDRPLHQGLVAAEDVGQVLAGAGDDARSSIGGGNGWGALRAAALGVAGFAQAAGGLGSNFGGAYGSSGEALAVDGADVAGKVMARGASGRYLGEEDYVGGGIFSAVDDDEDVYF